MPDDRLSAPRDRLPIKVIMPKQGTERRIQGGGTPPRPFRTVDREYRTHLSNQVSVLREATISQAGDAGVAPARVKLLPKAIAKSHRPEHLFSSETCPIIGGGRLGELFIKATPRGLNRLSGIIKDSHSDQLIKELSSVETIEPVTPSDRRTGMRALDLLQRSPRGKDGFITRVRLFNFGTEGDQHGFVDDLTVALATYHAAIERWPGKAITLRQGRHVIEDSRRSRLATLFSFPWSDKPPPERAG